MHMHLYINTVHAMEIQFLHVYERTVIWTLFNTSMTPLALQSQC